MTFFDWLSSSAGVELQHAVIVFLIAASGWLTFQTHRGVQENRRQLNHHLEQHVLDEVEKHANDK